MKIESKEKLARLLAVEDLDIQHQQVETAYFDIKNRCLILPTWKEMPDHVYDLLVGHEVGHALFTPSNLPRVEKAYKKSSKSCVNIVEDARIERMIKNRYPGLRKQFFNGYKHLIEKDFFGLSERPTENMNILDKLNLFFKIPNAVDLSFNDEETVFIERIEKSKSFKDVEKIAEDIYAYAKLKQKEKSDDGKPEDSGLLDDEKNEGEGGEGYDTKAEDKDFEENKEDIDNDDFSSGKDDKKDETRSEGDESSIDEDDEEKGLEKYLEEDKLPLIEKERAEKQEKEEQELKEEVRSTTLDHFQERLNGLVNKNVSTLYLNVPDKVDLDVGVEDYKKVHKQINDFYSSMNNNPEMWERYFHSGNQQVQFKAFQEYVFKYAHKTLNKIKTDSVKTVNHIAAEFERKKAADVYKKMLVTKTGVLDTNKLFSAKYNDDVFKKSVRIPEGKNHGLVMILDWSGSMSSNIFGCIKQVIELVLFCKKVNIPFEVYSFMERKEFETGEVNSKEEAKRTKPTFQYRHGDFVTDTRVCLRNYLSSRMSAKDFNNGLFNMTILANRHNPSPEFGRHNYYVCPKDDELGCTPLNGAILLAEHVIRNFKKKNNLECVHAVWLTDGEASSRSAWYDATQGEYYKQHTTDGMYADKQNIYLKDKKTKKNHLIYESGDYSYRGRSVTPACFDILKDRLGINIVGFFIVRSFTNSELWRYVPRQKGVTYEASKTHYANWVKQTKKDGFFVKEQSGYDEYYVIRGDNFKKEIDTNLDVKPEMTPRKMAVNFMKKNNAFKTNRIILSRFIDLITAKTMV